MKLNILSLDLLKACRGKFGTSLKVILINRAAKLKDA